MAKYDHNHKASGDAAKDGDLPDGFAITGAIRKGSTVYTAGQEDAYAASKPSAADVSRHAEAGALSIPEAKAKK